jgi:hypothetical protein
MKQCAQELLQNGISSIYVECDKINSLDELRPVLDKAILDGVRAVFLDEVTAAEDFQYNSSFLPNVYVAQGMRIVTAGADSLNIALARGDELYDRVYAIHTSYIPFAEYNRLIGKGIDEYIRYGGTLDDTIYRSKSKLQAYRNTAIADNIIHSIEKTEERAWFPPALTELYSSSELKSIINMVLDRMCRNTILKDCGGDCCNLEIPAEHLKEIKDYLECIDVFIKIPTYSSYKKLEQTESLEIVSQPGMVYAYYLAELKNDEYWKTKISDNYVKEIILESDIIANTYRKYNGENLYVSKLCAGNGKNSISQMHENYMVVLEKENELVDLFEIKYADKTDEKQISDLTNASFMNYVEENFGMLINSCVIYNGTFSEMFREILYLNAEKYLRDINRNLSWDEVRIVELNRLKEAKSMDRSLYGEYDNYDYSNAEGMSLDEQISFMKKTLKSAIRISQTNESDYIAKKIVEIKQKIQELESMKTD